MTRAEERLRVLRLIERGLLTAAEGARLLESLDQTEAPPAGEGPTGPAHRSAARQPRRLRVRVTDLQSGKLKIDFQMPWSLIGVGLALGARFTPPEVDVDFNEVVRNARGGTTGKVIDVVDDDDQEHVEIFIE